jgi:hypothetical protein
MTLGASVAAVKRRRLVVNEFAELALCLALVGDASRSGDSVGAILAKRVKAAARASEGVPEAFGSAVVCVLPN